MLLSNWAVTYGADGNDINETMVERVVVCCVCVRVRACACGRDRQRKGWCEEGEVSVMSDQRDTVALGSVQTTTTS